MSEQREDTPEATQSTDERPDSPEDAATVPPPRNDQDSTTTPATTETDDDAEFDGYEPL